MRGPSPKKKAWFVLAVLKSHSEKLKHMNTREKITSKYY
jgi:hypothetical protein